MLKNKKAAAKSAQKSEKKNGGQLEKKNENPDGRTIVVKGWAEAFIVIFMLLFVAQLIMLIVLNWGDK